MSNPVATFKVVLVGPGRTGKTTWIKRLLINRFEDRYVPTVGVEVHPITVQTSRGDVLLNMWDIGGQAYEIGVGLGSAYFIGSDAAIVMYSCRNGIDDEERARTFLPELERLLPDVPVAMVRSIDLTEHLPPKPNTRDLDLVEGANMSLPLRDILRVLMQDPNLELC